MSHRKNNFLLPIIFLSILGSTIIAAWSFVSYLMAPLNSSSSTPVNFVVNRGDSIKTISQNLFEKKLIKSAYSFRLAVYLERLSGKIQAGDYQLATNMSARQLAKALTKGYEQGVTITIPEGYRIEQIAELVANKLGIKYQDFVVVAKEEEGYLFPDTYNFNTDTTPEILVSILKSNWNQKTKSATPTRDELILASIVERETLSRAEKPVVAGILKKRLAEGWPLEVDATIQYMLGKKGDWWPTPLLGDRKLKSPFNSYLNLGLPPAPICNPGLEAIKAAMNPESSPYYFYLHDKNGNIHYASTNAEHNENIKKYIQ